jgi:hypothetical protein
MLASSYATDDKHRNVVYTLITQTVLFFFWIVAIQLLSLKEQKPNMR